MKIAIPSESDAGLDSIRSGHFGHAPYFTLVTIEDGNVVEVESVKNVDHDVEGCGGVIQYALSLGIDGLIAAGMGRPPYMRFTQGGVQVYFEAETPSVGGVVEKFLAGGVQAMGEDNVCSHH